MNQPISGGKMKSSSLGSTKTQIATKTLVFNFEGTLLRSSSLFPYFMLVAFEAGGILRSLILFLSYPLVWLVGEDQLGLNIMVFLCFFGLRIGTFRIGSSVLPKFFLEDVGWESFEAVMCYEKRVASSKLPRVMVEGVLNDYLGVESVIARDLKCFSGYCLGLFEDKNKNDKTPSYEVPEGNKNSSSNIIGTAVEYIDQDLFFHKVVNSGFSSKERRTTMQVLPKERYLKPLIFHDGRLALRPTPTSCLVLLMWLPFGLFLSIFRVFIGIILPLHVSATILPFTGTRTTVSTPPSLSHLTEKIEKHQKGTLYVCNHKTLLDPIFIALALDKHKPVSAVTYSLSRFNELVSPIRNTRLTRDRDTDKESMEKLLSLGNLVVCPEGTTCREPYLLRFSPLFAELTDDIVPVAVDVKVSMFYGTTASGHKCLDPFFHFMNPNPIYFVKMLERLPPSQTCHEGGKSRIEVAEYVQHEIGNALAFACTSLTRKAKYMILAGNQGVY